jgi:hypothetical protein
MLMIQGQNNLSQERQRTVKMQSVVYSNKGVH